MKASCSFSERSTHKRVTVSEAVERRCANQYLEPRHFWAFLAESIVLSRLDNLSWHHFSNSQEPLEEDAKMHLTIEAFSCLFLGFYFSRTFFSELSTYYNFETSFPGWSPKIAPYFEKLHS